MVPFMELNCLLSSPISLECPLTSPILSSPLLTPPSHTQLGDKDHQEAVARRELQARKNMLEDSVSHEAQLCVAWRA